jgi:hypothetical protein
MSPDSNNDSKFQFPQRSSRGVGEYTDDAIAVLVVGSYLGVWAASYAFPEVPRPPLSDATVMTVTQASFVWVFGKKAYDRVKQSSRSS